MIISKTINYFLHSITLAWSTVVIIYSILAVELTLRWNHVQGVSEVRSTGQFIPLFTGLLGLTRAVVLALIEHKDHFRKVMLCHIWLG
jgi:hypothetical protein